MDHKIYIYNGETYRLKGTCDRHNSHIKEVSYLWVFFFVRRYLLSLIILRVEQFVRVGELQRGQHVFAVRLGGRGAPVL